MAAIRRRSVTSLVRTWPSTIMRRAAAKSVIGVFRKASWEARAASVAATTNQAQDDNATRRAGSVAEKYLRNRLRGSHRYPAAHLWGVYLGSIPDIGTIRP